MENALGLMGNQAVMMSITFAMGLVGLAALFLAVFWPTRWRLKYRVEIGFVVVLLGLVAFADARSRDTYEAYEASLKAVGAASGIETVSVSGAFDRTLTVVAFQWGFAFVADGNLISRNAAIVKPDEKIRFRILSNDVIHGFNIPVAGLTTEFDPGEARDVWIRAPKKPGKYLIQCLNYCGVGHAQMKAWLVVEGEEDAA